MTNTPLARINMVRNQLLPNKIEDPYLLESMGTLPRESFVPKHYVSTAYIDDNIPLKNGHFLLAPVAFAQLAQLACIKQSDTVLDVGCGSGYSTAVFSSIARKVIAIESDEALASSANSILNKLDIRNAIIISEPHAEGHSEGGLYNVIFLNGAVEMVPPKLFEQLADNGRLVTVIQPPGVLGQATCFKRHGDTIINESSFGLTIPALPLVSNYAA